MVPMKTAPIRVDWVGRVIDGRFTLLQWLGGSERSGVFLTELEGRTQKTVIKLIPTDATDTGDPVKSRAAASALSHPHLMRQFQTGTARIDAVQLHYTVTEYAEEDLSQILPVRPLTPSEVRDMLDPVLDTLSFLHQKGFLHGHLKPSNIMVVDDQLKLSSDSVTATGSRHSRPIASDIHSAPEAATDIMTAASDVWSLGATLVESLTQHPPEWDKSTPKEPVVPESIPQPFADIARECLRSDPARRCTLSYIRLRLDPDRMLPETPRKTGKTKSLHLRLPLLIVAALLLFAAIVFSLLRTHPDRPSSPAANQPPGAASVPPAQSTPPTSQLSNGSVVKGVVAQRVMPDVPERAMRTIHGTVQVKIRVAVSPAGDVSNATIESAGPSRYFASLALKAVPSWKFKPAQADGRAVPSIWIFDFKFRQSGVEVAPIESAP